VSDVTAHHFEHHPTIAGPLAGRPTQDERCADCSVRRTTATEHSACPPEWQEDGVI
jgi:hypothetical protein